MSSGNGQQPPSTPPPPPSPPLPPLPPSPPSPKRPSLRKLKPYPYIERPELLIDNFGLPFLLQEGYINLSSIPNPDPGFGYGKHTTPAVAYRQYKMTGNKPDDGKVVMPVGEEYYIHPIFDRDMWDVQELGSSSMPHWDALKPVWQLATLLLEEKVMSGFLCGMLDRSTHRDLNTTEAGQKLHSFEAKQNPTQKELWNLWETIWRLKNVIRFEAYEKRNDEDHCVFGITDVDQSSAGLTPSGKGSTISINEDVLSLLCSKTRPMEYSISNKIDEASCLLRLRFQLATTLVHELVHALWIAHFADSFEPFYRDYHCAELGWTYESLLADGAISNISDRTTSVYGLKIQDFPGKGHGFSAYPRLAVPLITPRTMYFPVPMNWVPTRFTQKHWDDVQRFGLPAFKCPRTTHWVCC